MSRARVMWIKTYFNHRAYIFLLVTSFSEYLLIYLEFAVCKAFRFCNNALNLMIEPIELQLPARSLQLDIPVIPATIPKAQKNPVSLKCASLVVS